MEKKEIKKKKKITIKISSHDFKKTNYELATSRLLHMIMDASNGPVQMGLKSKFTYQKFINWRVLGHIPLNHVGFVSRSLKLPPAALNYTQVIGYEGKGKEFKEVVECFAKEHNYSKTDVAWILKGKMPPTLKEILK